MTQIIIKKDSDERQKRQDILCDEMLIGYQKIY